MAEPMESAMQRRYRLMREQAQQQEQVAKQQEQGALQRRFATMGALGSGAALRTQRLADEASQRRMGERMAGIDIAQAGEQAQQEESEKARAFATSERLGSQGFQAEQAGLGRKFATSEREAGQGFQAEQAGLGRQFATSERLGSQQFAASESALGRAQQTAQFREQMDFQKNQANVAQKNWADEFEVNKETNEFNKEIARETMDMNKRGVIDQLTGVDFKKLNWQQRQAYGVLVNPTTLSSKGW